MSNPASTPPAPQQPSGAAPKKSGRSRIAGLVLLAVVAAGGFGGYRYYVNHTRYFETENAKVAADLVAVSGKAGGRIQQLNVSVGQTVQKGDLLVQLDAEQAQATVAQAEAALNLARAQRDKVRGGARSEELRQAAEAVQQAAAVRDAARKQYESVKNLREQGVSPQSQLDQVTGQYRSAEAALAAAQARLDLVQSGASDADLAVAEAQVKQAEAALNVARLALDYTRVTAPGDGTVIAVNVRAGETVAPGQPLIVLSNLNSLRIDANVEETDISRIKAGQPVDIQVDAFPGRHFSGKVQEVGMATGSVFSLIPTDTTSGNFTKVVQRVPVKIALPADAVSRGFRPGMSAMVKVQVGE